MTGITVLVTGVTGYVGSELAGRLASHPGVDRVIGVDAALPGVAARARLGNAEFARADIRNPVIAKVIEAAGVDTVVHASTSVRASGSAAGSMAKEMNVLGTMQLLAACQRSSGVRNLVVRSTSAVYGSSPRDAAVATEDTVAHSVPSTGPVRDAIDIEGYVRGFGRRRPDVRIAVPRFAEIVGPTVRTPLTNYFSIHPLVPVVAGQDTRIQLLHETDVVALLEHLVHCDFAGTVNAAGDGAMTITQAIRRAGRIPLHIPQPALEGFGRTVRLLRFGGFSATGVRVPPNSRVLDTATLRQKVGFTPAFSTVAAFDDFVTRLHPVLDARSVRAAELRVAAALGVSAEPDGPWLHPSSSSATSTTTPDLPPDPGSIAAGRPGSGSAPARRLFSVGGEAARRSPGGAPRPGSRQR